MTKPKVTIVTAVYNGEAYLPSAVASVLNQSLPHFRWLIVDDGSSDNTPRILQKLASEDERVKIITQSQNMGLTIALNRAFKLVNSPYFARFDADDICHLDRLKKQIEFLDGAPDVVLCATWARIIDDTARPTLTLKKAPAEIDALTLFRSNPLVHSSWCGRTNAFRLVGGYDNTFSLTQDYELLWRLRKKGKIAVIQTPYVDYRETKISVSARKTRQSLLSALKIRIGALKRKDVPFWYSILLIEPLLGLVFPEWIKRWRRRRQLSPIFGVISPELGVSPKSNSGGEVYDREVLEHLVAEGVDVALILPRKREYNRNVFRQVQFIPFQRIAPPYSFNFLLLPALFKLYHRLKYSIIRVHSPYFTGLGILVFCFFYPRSRVVVSYLHVEAFPLWRLIDRLVLNRADHVFTISQSTKRELMATYALPSNKISVTYCGIDPKYRPEAKSQTLKKRYDIPKNTTILLYLGGLKPRKNLPFLLEVFARLPENNCILVFGGAGSEEPKLKLMAKQLGVSSRVRFAGYVKEEEKVPLYNLADIFLFPTEREGFGMVAAEAMACGIPVVASNVTSLPEVVINGRTGLLPRVNDHRLWVDAISRLIRDPKLRHKMGREGRKHVLANFSWRKLAREQLAVMKRLTESI